MRARPERSPSVGIMWAATECRVRPRETHGTVLNTVALSS